MKKLLILAGVIVLTTTTQVIANENAQFECPSKPQNCPCVSRELPPPPFEFGKMKMMKKHHADFKNFEAQLDLTSEQKIAVKKLKEEEFAKIKPIREQIKSKYSEIEAVMNERLTFKERQDKLEPIKKEIFALHKQIRKIKHEGKEEFKALLTDKQLKKLEQLKSERVKEFKKHEKSAPRYLNHPPMPRDCGCENPQKFDIPEMEK